MPGKFTLVRIAPELHHPNCALRIDYPEIQDHEDLFTDSIFEQGMVMEDEASAREAQGKGAKNMDFTTLCESIFGCATLAASSFRAGCRWSTPTLSDVLDECDQGCRFFSTPRGLDFFEAAAARGFEIFLGWVRDNPRTTVGPLEIHSERGIRKLTMDSSTLVNGRHHEYNRPINGPFLVIVIARSERVFRIWCQPFRLQGLNFFAVDSGAEWRHIEKLGAQKYELIKVNRQAMKRLREPFAESIVRADLNPDYLFQAPSGSNLGILEIFASGSAEYMLNRGIKIPILSKIAQAHGITFAYADVLLRKRTNL